MKKIVKIMKTAEQTRANIPKDFVKKLRITKDSQIEWELKGNKLTGRLLR